jgi:hypothetical protein
MAASPRVAAGPHMPLARAAAAGVHESLTDR